ITLTQAAATVAIDNRPSVTILLSQCCPNVVPGGRAMKPKKPLTDRSISAAKPADPGKRRLLWDAVVPGLAVRVTDQGAKSFVLVTRYPGSSNPAPRSLGTYGTITLADARTKAQAWYKQIAAGIDPTAAEADRLAQTFRAISDDYFVRKANAHRSKEWAQS